RLRRVVAFAVQTTGGDDEHARTRRDRAQRGDFAPQAIGATVDDAADTVLLACRDLVGHERDVVVELVSWVARSEREVLVNERRTGEALRIDVLEQGPDDRPGWSGRSQRSRREVGFESASDGAEDGRGAQNA